MGENNFELGPLEMEVIGLLKKRSPLSVREVQKLLEKSGKDLAYTTVMTVLDRLYKKGYTSRQKEGRQFLHSPSEQSIGLGRNVLSKIGATLFQNEKLKPILALLGEGEELSAAELKELKLLVDKKLKEVKKSGSR